MLRLRFTLSREEGQVSSFLIQLEYNGEMIPKDIGGWCPIARFDHNPDAVDGHDVAAEGLHLDLLDPSDTKHDVKRGFEQVDIADCPEYCEGYLLCYATYFAAEFEKRNGLSGEYTE